MTKAFQKVEPMNWGRLHAAEQFYRARGFQYEETPWVVPLSVAQETMPSDANPFFVYKGDSSREEAVLVGSAEQGFLSLREDGRLRRNQRYVSVSPCFRGESDSSLVPGVTQLVFMKVELFSWTLEGSTDYLQFMSLAREFMESQGAKCTVQKTELGWDLICGGVEVGSYGCRDKGTIQYGTGLAEPRFTFALAGQ